VQGNHGDVALNTSPPRAQGQPMRFGFRVGQLRLLITPQTFSEVVMQAVIYPLPIVPIWFLGLLNQRGNLLPVFDLHQLLEAGNRSHDKRTVLVLDQGSDAVGIPIDGMPQAITLKQTLGHVPPLPTVLAAHVLTAYTTGEMVWLEFDHRGFFTAIGTQIMREHPGNFRI
jgi:twitching motility protein PilI